MVVAVFVVQALIWIQLEFTWYPEDYALLLPETGTEVTQDEFISIIAGMTEHATWSNRVLELGSLNLILLLMRILEMCTRHPRLAFITKTLAKSIDNLMPYGLLALLFIIAFGYAGTLLFGQTQSDFVTISFAVLKMWNMLLGDFDTAVRRDVMPVRNPLPAKAPLLLSFRRCDRSICKAQIMTGLK